MWAPSPFLLVILWILTLDLLFQIQAQPARLTGIDYEAFFGASVPVRRYI